MHAAQGMLYLCSTSMHDLANDYKMHFVSMLRNPAHFMSYLPGVELQQESICMQISEDKSVEPIALHRSSSLAGLSCLAEEALQCFKGC